MYIPATHRKLVPPAILEGNHKDKYDKNKSGAMEFSLETLGGQRRQHEAYPASPRKQMRENWLVLGSGRCWSELVENWEGNTFLTMCLMLFNAAPCTACLKPTPGQPEVSEQHMQIQCHRAAEKLPAVSFMAINKSRAPALVSVPQSCQPRSWGSGINPLAASLLGTRRTGLAEGPLLTDQRVSKPLCPQKGSSRSHGNTLPFPVAGGDITSRLTCDCWGSLYQRGRTPGPRRQYSEGRSPWQPLLPRARPTPIHHATLLWTPLTMRSNQIHSTHRALF